MCKKKQILLKQIFLHQTRNKWHEKMALIQKQYIDKKTYYLVELSSANTLNDCFCFLQFIIGSSFNAFNDCVIQLEFQTK
jgi:hypothetical protein